ncbi:MAG: aminopeptidase [Bacteroides sp.]|nr:aminopeptidase [Bacteroides sp.]
MKQRSFKLFMLLVLTLCVMTARAADIEVLNKLKSLPGVTQVDTLASKHYANKYVMYIDQLLDPAHPEVGSFKQRVILAHVGYDRPTVLVTEGYDANYAVNPNYKEELSVLLNANLVFVEYRYFGESMPQPCNWAYLTVKNSLADLHRVNITFRNLYSGKWVATGISKGGQTTMFYRSYYPDDVDVSVPYVAPLNQSLEDGRHEVFLSEKVGTAKERKAVEEAQLTLLKRKQALLPMLAAYCKEKGYTFRVPLEEVFDYCVLEYAFALWQWGTPVANIPSEKDSDKVWFDHLIAINAPDYFSQQSPFPSFNVQAAKELGYYGYDVEPFKAYLSIATAKDYLRRVMLPEELDDLTFDDALYRHTVDFLKNEDPKMIYIYGENDPWTASGVTWLEGKKNIHVFVHPRGSHSTRIATFSEKKQREIKSLLEDWLDVKLK